MVLPFPYCADLSVNHSVTCSDRQFREDSLKRPTDDQVWHVGAGCGRQGSNDEVGSWPCVNVSGGKMPSSPVE